MSTEHNGRYFGKPAPDDDGMLEGKLGPSNAEQDARFQEALARAMSRGKERMPPQDRTPPARTPRRIIAVTHVQSASNLEN
jgi:hypothetical protein